MLNFFKPKWQHKDPKVRLSAIERMDLDEKTLMTIAQSDSASSVRVMAASKISNVIILYSLWESEKNHLVQETIIEFIAKGLESFGPADRQFEELIQQIDNEHFPYGLLICKTRNRKIERQLFNKVERIYDYLQIIKNSHWLLDEALLKINDATLLQDLLKDVRKNDKRTYKLTKERLNQILAVKNLAQIKQELLMRYQEIAQNNELVALNIFSDLEESWNEYGFGDERTQFKETYLQRYHAHNAARTENLKLINKIKQEIEKDTIPNEFLQQCKTVLTELSDRVDLALNEEIEQLLVQIDKKSTHFEKMEVQQQKLESLYKEVDRLLDHSHRVELIKLEDLLKKLRDVVPMDGLTESYISRVVERKQAQDVAIKFNQPYFLALIEALGVRVKAGELQEALSQEQQIYRDLKEAHALTKKEHDFIVAQLKQMTGPLKEMQDWAQWSSSNALEQLCLEAEQLGAQENVSSEYIVLTLKKLRKDWFEAVRGLGRNSHSYRKRFDEACNKAFERVKNERESNQMNRDHYIKEAKLLLEKLETLIENIDWSKPRWRELSKMRSDFLKEWNRYLAQYSNGELLSYGTPLFLEKDRRKLEQSMRAIMATLNDRFKIEQQAEKKRREEMIEALIVLNQANDIEKAVELAKKANREFSPTVRLNYRDENKLWARLRSVCDDIFEKRQNLQEIEDSEREKNLGKKYKIIIRLEDLLNTFSDSDIDTISDELNAFQRQWDEVGSVSRNKYKEIEERFKNNVSRLNALKETFLQEQNNKAWRVSFEQAVKLGTIEEALLDETPDVTLGSLAKDMHTALRQRYECAEKIIKGDQGAYLYLASLKNNAEELAHQLCVQREILKAIETPEEDKNLRMQLQVEKLQSSMTAERTSDDLISQLDTLNEQWLRSVVGRVSDTLYERFLA